MQHEAKRLQTFCSWRTPDVFHPSAVQLAHQGFFLHTNDTQHPAMVACFSCQVSLYVPISSDLMDNAHLPSCRRFEQNHPIGSSNSCHVLQPNQQLLSRLTQLSDHHSSFNQSEDHIDEVSSLFSTTQSEHQLHQCRHITNQTSRHLENQGRHIQEQRSHMQNHSSSLIPDKSSYLIADQASKHLQDQSRHIQEQHNGFIQDEPSQNLIEQPNEHPEARVHQDIYTTGQPIQPDSPKDPASGPRPDKQASNLLAPDDSHPSPAASHPQSVGQPADFHREAEAGGQPDSQEPPQLTLQLSAVAYPQYCSQESRVQTFQGWNPSHSQRPEPLSQAGFFFAGYADCVRCFCCGLGLKFWRPGDVISYQHARFRPGCAYNLLYKGQAYVDNVQREIQAQQVTNQNIEPGPQHSQPSAGLQAVENLPVGSQTPDQVSSTTTPNGTIQPTNTTSASNLQTATTTSNGTIQSSTTSDHHAKPTPHKPKNSQTSAEIPAKTRGQEPGEELRVVETEHRLLAERTTCRQCRSSPVGAIFLPCGHVATCQTCADKTDNCIICGRRILGTAHVFMA